MSEYPYYDAIRGRMKGEQEEIEKVKKRLALLFKAEVNEDDDGEIYYVIENNDGDEIINDGYEKEFLDLCYGTYDFGGSSDRKLVIDEDGYLSLQETGDGFNAEKPWKRLYSAISNMFPDVCFFFSTSIGGEYGEGAAWHAITDGECYDSGYRNYESGGLFIAKCLLENFYEPEIEARNRLWEIEDGQDQNDIDNARKEYEKLRQKVNSMEKIAKIGNIAWVKGDSNSLDFKDLSRNIDNDLFCGLLETIENQTFNYDDNTDEFPASLSEITAINLEGCEQIDMLPEAIMRCTSLEAINITDTSIKKIPAWLRKMQEDGVNVSKNNMKGVRIMAKKKIKTVEEALAAIQDGLDLKEIPDDFRTEEICLAAVQEEGNELEFVPDKLKTEEICFEAVKKRSMALEFVPDKLKTEEICLEAVQKNAFALQYIPDKLKTMKICLAAVQQNGRALFHVPDKLKTAEIFLAAVQENGDVIQDVPDKLKTEEICLAAVQRSAMAFSFVSDKLKTAKICLAAVKKNGGNLEYVPDKLKTEEICLAAIKDDEDALEYVPEALRAKVESALKSSENDGKKNISP